MAKFITAKQAAELIPDGATVGIAGMGLSGWAEEIACAIRDRYAETGHPRGINLKQGSAIGDWGYGNGFTFRNYDIADMCNAVKRALAGIYDNEGWHQLMWRAMMSDNSWERSAQDYINVYEDTMHWL